MRSTPASVRNENQFPRNYRSKSVKITFSTFCLPLCRLAARAQFWIDLSCQVPEHTALWYTLAVRENLFLLRFNRVSVGWKWKRKDTCGSRGILTYVFQRFRFTCGFVRNKLVWTGPTWTDLKLACWVNLQIYCPTIWFWLSDSCRNCADPLRLGCSEFVNVLSLVLI